MREASRPRSSATSGSDRRASESSSASSTGTNASRGPKRTLLGGEQGGLDARQTALGQIQRGSDRNKAVWEGNKTNLGKKERVSDANKRVSVVVEYLSGVAGDLPAVAECLSATAKSLSKGRKDDRHPRKSSRRVASGVLAAGSCCRAIGLNRRDPNAALHTFLHG